MGAALKAISEAACILQEKVEVVEARRKAADDAKAAEQAAAELDRKAKDQKLADTMAEVAKCNQRLVALQTELAREAAARAAAEQHAAAAVAEAMTASVRAADFERQLRVSRQLF